jgi:hypothetical protein
MAARDHPSTGHIEALCEPVRDRKSISFIYYRGGLAAARCRLVLSINGTVIGVTGGKLR